MSGRGTKGVSSYLGNGGSHLPRHTARLLYEHPRADGDILSVRTPVRQPKHLITGAEAVVPFSTGAEGVNGPAELHTESVRGLWWERIRAVALEDVHAVDAEGLDLDEGLARRRLRGRDVGVEEQGLTGAGAALDICRRC